MFKDCFQINEYNQIRRKLACVTCDMQFINPDKSFKAYVIKENDCHGPWDFSQKQRSAAMKRLQESFLSSSWNGNETHFIPLKKIKRVEEKKIIL